MTITELPPGTPTKIAYRAINGDDATGELDNMEKPFVTLPAIFKAFGAFVPGTFIPQIKDIGYLPQPRVKPAVVVPVTPSQVPASFDI